MLILKNPSHSSNIQKIYQPRAHNVRENASEKQSFVQCILRYSPWSESKKTAMVSGFVRCLAAQKRGQTHDAVAEKLLWLGLLFLPHYPPCRTDDGMVEVDDSDDIAPDVADFYHTLHVVHQTHCNFYNFFFN